MQTAEQSAMLRRGPSPEAPTSPPPGRDEGRAGAARRILRRYGETTSIKGVPKVFKARDATVRIMWLVAVLFGGTLAAYQLSILLITYFARPTVTRVEEKYEPPSFPDITLCNQNPLSRHHFRHLPTADDFTRRMGQFLMETFINASKGYYNDTPAVNMTPVEVEEIASTLFSASAYYQNLPRSNQVAADMFHMFFKDCVFYSWDMSILNLTCHGSAIVTGLFFPDHYACFTVSVPDEYRARVKGASFVLYLDQSGNAVFHQYKLNMFHPKSTGVRVVVHPRDTLPVPGDGDTIPPGQETTVRLFPHVVSRLSEPYGACTSKRLLEYPDDYESPGPVRPKVYTKSSCIGVCQQDRSIGRCGCLDLAHTYTKRQMDSHRGVPYCGNASLINLDKGVVNITRETFELANARMLCAIRARSATANYTGCDCPAACETTFYTKSVSQAPWPIRDYQIGFFQQYIFGTPLQDEFREYLNITSWYFNRWPDARQVDLALRRVENKIENSFLQFNVLFTEQIVESVAERPLLTWDKILANIGGAMNLWIGITFITIIEMTEVLYYLVWLLIGPRKANDATAQQQGEPVRT